MGIMIDATQVLELPVELISGSCAELGPDAAKITWNNALEHAERLELGTLIPSGIGEHQFISELVDHFDGYGAWSREELEAMPQGKLMAMLLQDIAAAIREEESGWGSGRISVDRDEHGEPTAASFWLGE